MPRHTPSALVLSASGWRIGNVQAPARSGFGCDNMKHSKIGRLIEIKPVILPGTHATGTGRYLTAVLRQVDAAFGKFRRSLDQSANSTFALVKWKRRVEQVLELADRLFFDVEGVAPEPDMRRSGARRVQTKLDQSANGVGAHHAVHFSPRIDLRRQLLRQLYRADGIATRANGVALSTGVGHVQLPLQAQL
jgi:hypothetical protein